MSATETRFSSKVRTLLTFGIHLSAVVMFSYALYYDCNYIAIPDNLKSKTIGSIGGRFKYITYWDHILQTVYFNIALGDNLYEFYKGQPNLELRKVRDYMFASIAFPIGLFVSTSFWTFFFIDRELIFPAVMDEVVPKWLNHFIHTNVAIFPILHMFTVSHKYPARKSALIGHLTFTVTYGAWVHYIHYRTNKWVYPFLRRLNMLERSIFFGSVLMVGVFWYFVGEFINHKLNGNEPETEPIKEN